MPAPKMHGRAWDAVVVGGGPAGATCALELARRDRRVLILEKERWPRYKTCGGGLIGRARDLVGLPLDSVIERRSHRVELRLADLGMVFTVVRDRPVVSMTMRSDLDAHLVTQAREAGAAFESGSKPTRMERREDGWLLDIGERSLRTRYVVGADGAASSVARCAGWPEQRHLVPAIESEIEVDDATLRHFQDAARFDLGAAPAGYAWVFPKKDHLSVGCLSFQSLRPDLRRHLQRHVDRLEIHPLDRREHGFVIPVRPRATTLARDRVLLTGDAAGLADPVLGEGISNAIWSGRLAAEAICDPGPQGATVTYQRALAVSILPELRRARLLARLLYHAPRLRARVFRRVGQSLSEVMADLIAGERTYHSLLERPGGWLRPLLSPMGPGPQRPTPTGR